MTNADHHFLIGRSHTICEDYCASQPQFAALSDGCSCVVGSDGKRMNAHTDIGARLLVRAAFHHQIEANLTMLFQLAVHTANGYRRQMDLPVETLSATLLTLRSADNGNRVQAAICGDGVVAARRKTDKNWNIYQYQFDGPPVYPRYCLMNTVPQASLCRLTKLPAGGGCDNLDPFFMPFFGMPLSFPRDEYDLVVALSDGAFSFTQDSVPVPFADIANRLLDFRGLRGRFVLRHLAGVTEELAKDGFIHQDDLSMIAMHLKQE